MAMLLGVLVLGLASQGRVAARHAVNGAACAIAGLWAIVGGLIAGGSILFAIAAAQA